MKGKGVGKVSRESTHATAEGLATWLGQKYLKGMANILWI